LIVIRVLCRSDPFAYVFAYSPECYVGPTRLRIAPFAYSLRATYKMFELDEIPDFSNKNWANSKKLIDKRHALMHPKKPSDLPVSESSWQNIHDGALWLIKQHFDISKLLYEKYK